MKKYFVSFPVLLLALTAMPCFADTCENMVSKGYDCFLKMSASLNTTCGTDTYIRMIQNKFMAEYETLGFTRQQMRDDSAKSTKAKQDKKSLVYPKVIQYCELNIPNSGGTKNATNPQKSDSWLVAEDNGNPINTDAGIVMAAEDNGEPVNTDKKTEKKNPSAMDQLDAQGPDLTKKADETAKDIKKKSEQSAVSNKKLQPKCETLADNKKYCMCEVPDHPGEYMFSNTLPLANCEKDCNCTTETAHYLNGHSCRASEILSGGECIERTNRYYPAPYACTNIEGGKWENNSCTCTEELDKWDPENQICVEKIEKLKADVAKPKAISAADVKIKTPQPAAAEQLTDKQIEEIAERIKQSITQIDVGASISYPSKVKDEESVKAAIKAWVDACKNSYTPGEKQDANYDVDGENTVATCLVTGCDNEEYDVAPNGQSCVKKTDIKADDKAFVADIKTFISAFDAFVTKYTEECKSKADHELKDGECKPKTGEKS